MTIETCTNLNDLCETLNARPADERADADDGDLPTFGGEAPASTAGIYSWDEDSFLVPATDRSFRVVSRAEF